jgi:translocation and assembly module TamB
LALDVPKFDFYLEEQLDLELQTLEAPTDIEVGARQKGGAFIRYDRSKEDSPSSGSGPLLELKLGKDVWIHRGRGAFVAVRGSLDRDVNGRFKGQLTLPEGQVDVLGRVFEIDQGVVTFEQDDPPNPIVIVQASWESPSGYRITAEYRGPVDDGTLTLSSDPPLTQDQVLNVLLFDDPEGGLDEERGGGASALATTVATSGLSSALSDLSNLDISAGVDTSEEDNARPEVGVRLSPRWSVELQYNPEGGTDAISRTPDRALVSLRARITRRWSVETTVGDQGTSILDFMWRYRY